MKRQKEKGKTYLQVGADYANYNRMKRHAFEAVHTVTVTIALVVSGLFVGQHQTGTV